MNAALFDELRLAIRNRGRDCCAPPELPPADLAEDILGQLSRATAALGEALGLDVLIQGTPALFRRPRTLELLNLQIALLRSMILLGYEYGDLERRMCGIFDLLTQNIHEPNPDPNPDPILDPASAA